MSESNNNNEEKEFQLGPKSFAYIGINLIVLIVVTLIGNYAPSKPDLTWIRYALGGELLAGIGLIMTYNSSKTTRTTQNKYTGIFLAIVGVVILIYGIVKRFLL